MNFIKKNNLSLNKLLRRILNSKFLSLIYFRYGIGQIQGEVFADCTDSSQSTRNRQEMPTKNDIEEDCRR